MIYLDYNATTPLCDVAREAMLPYLDRHFGNPSSVHAAGREARAAIDNARDKLAALLRVKPNELIFTSGGTESCNLAVFGLARCRMQGGGHVISAKTEHHAVLNAIEHLEKQEGFEVTWLNVSRDGIIDLDQLADAIRPETRLVSIMSANNETGVIQPMREISRHMPRARRSAAHATWCNRLEKSMPTFPWSMPPVLPRTNSTDQRALDFFSCAVVFRSSRSCSVAHTKMSGGPEQKMSRQLWEWQRLRSGSSKSVRKSKKREQKLRDELWTRIAENVPDAKQNGANAPRLANTLNVSLLGIDSEMLLIALDLEGVCASSGSACMVGSVVASHVLLAMGLPMERARSAVRFSLGKWTTADEIKAAGAAVRKIVDRLNTRKSAYAVA